MSDIYGENLGTQHLAANPQLYYPQTSDIFEFIVTGVDKLLRLGADENSINPYITNAQEVIRLSTDASAVPSFSQELIKVARGNQIISFAGKPTFSGGKLTINDYVGAKSLDALLAWQRLSYNLKNQSVGHAEDYKKTCYLNVYDSNNKLIRTYTLYGCWIQDLPQEEFQVGRGEGRKITATIIYDTFTMDLPEII